MRRLHVLLRKAEAEREELLLALKIQDEYITALRDIVEKTKIEIKKVTPTVADKLEKTVRETHGGKETVLAVILSVFSTHPEPVNIKDLTELVNMKRPMTSQPSVQYALTSGLKSGVLKKSNQSGEWKWCLNETKEEQKKITRADHTRPNQGIMYAVIDEINIIVKAEKGRLFSSYYIFEQIKEDFPKASEMSVTSVLNKLAADKTPGFYKKQFGQEVSYTAHQLIRR